MSDGLDEEQLTPPSKSFWRQLVFRLPQVRPFCSLEAQKGYPGQHLRVQIPSPQGPDRNVVLWMESGEEPSLAFGGRGWHTHGDNVRRTESGTFELETLVDLLEAILGDRFVLVEVPGNESGPFGSVLDLRDPLALLEELTEPGNSGRIRIKSFTGTADREVTLADLE